MASTDFSRLKRERYPMPSDIETALSGNELRARYDARPAYQQNDYIGWITRAKREATRRKRLDQMLAELREGNVYMNMAYSPRA